MRFRFITFFALCALLVGCSTPEYRQARNQCAYQAYQQYPINNITQVVSVQRPVQVPTGQTNCTTDYFGNTATTSCQQVMRTEFRNFQETVVVDTNQNGRNNAINYCAAQTCMNTYGNSDCKKQELKSDSLKESNCTVEANAYARNSVTNYANEQSRAYDACMRR